jgi:hypothetical protein
MYVANVIGFSQVKTKDKYLHGRKLWLILQHVGVYIWVDVDFGEDV